MSAWRQSSAIGQSPIFRNAPLQALPRNSLRHFAIQKNGLQDWRRLQWRVLEAREPTRDRARAIIARKE